MLDWKTEENVLLDIKKIIAVVWRMNPEQLSCYHKKLQENAQAALPGRIGSAFLDILGQMSMQPANSGTKDWSELMHDADCLLNLIHRQGNLNETAWRAALQKLELQPGRSFRTELGRAFILALKEKLGIELPKDQILVTGQKELERIAAWLMQDKQDQGMRIEGTYICQEHPAHTKYTATRQEYPVHIERAAACREYPIHTEQITRFQNRIAGTKSLRISTGVLRQAAVVVFSCLSFCLMGIWLHGQVERNQNRWNLQQMKVSASKEADVFMAEQPQAQADAAVQPENRTKTGDNAKDTLGQSSGAQIKAALPSSGAQTLPEILPQYKKMSVQYPELFGWLQIPGTQIDFPVMRTEGDDPEFYLHHDITGAESVEGALFVDTSSSSYPQDDNTVVYGHNMKNGHIFGTLKMYGVADFFRDHLEIHFDTLYETGVYEAVAVLKTRILNENEQGFRYYQFFQYENETEFQECVDFVEKNRLFETDSALQYGDQILMLSTCEYSRENGRLVVVARRME